MEATKYVAKHSSFQISKLKILFLSSFLQFVPSATECVSRQILVWCFKYGRRDSAPQQLFLGLYRWQRSGLDTGYHHQLSGFPGIHWSGVSSMVGVTRHRSIKWSASFSHDSTKLREKWNIPWLSNHSCNHITILLCKIKLTFKQSKTL